MIDIAALPKHFQADARRQLARQLRGDPPAIHNYYKLGPDVFKRTRVEPRMARVDAMPFAFRQLVWEHGQFKIEDLVRRYGWNYKRVMKELAAEQVDKLTDVLEFTI